MGQNILRAINSVIISTSGRPVAPDTIFSLPVFAFDFTPTCFVVMVESSRAPNIFPAPVNAINLLRRNFDRDLPTPLNEEFDHRPLRDAPFVTPPPLSVF